MHPGFRRAVSTLVCITFFLMGVAPAAASSPDVPADIPDLAALLGNLPPLDPSVSIPDPLEEILSAVNAGMPTGVQPVTANGTGSAAPSAPRVSHQPDPVPGSEPRATSILDVVDSVRRWLQ